MTHNTMSNYFINESDKPIEQRVDGMYTDDEVDCYYANLFIDEDDPVELEF